MGAIILGQGMCSTLQSFPVISANVPACTMFSYNSMVCAHTMVCVIVIARYMQRLHDFTINVLTLHLHVPMYLRALKVHSDWLLDKHLDPQY